MSALTEKVAREHRPAEILSAGDGIARHLYVGCTCGVGPLSALSHAAHVAAVTEAATRAAVAAEIRADPAQVVHGELNAFAERAARIAEGERVDGCSAAV